MTKNKHEKHFVRCAKFHMKSSWKSSRSVEKFDCAGMIWNGLCCDRKKNHSCCKKWSNQNDVAMKIWLFVILRRWQCTIEQWRVEIIDRSRQRRHFMNNQKKEFTMTCNIWRKIWRTRFPWICFVWTDPRNRKWRVWSCELLNGLCALQTRSSWKSIYQIWLLPVWK